MTRTVGTWIPACICYARRVTNNANLIDGLADTVVPAGSSVHFFYGTTNNMSVYYELSIDLPMSGLYIGTGLTTTITYTVTDSLAHP